MLTQIVMLISIVALFWGSQKIFQKSKKANFPAGKVLALALLFTGISILFYAVRDVFIQFNYLSIEYALYVIGGIMQALGTFAILYFVFKEFAPKRVGKVLLWVVDIITVGLLFSIIFLPKLSIVKLAPIELIPYTVISHPWISNAVNLFFITSVLLFSLFILAIFLRNMRKVESKNAKIKAVFYALGVLLLFSPAILCVFVSPIFARLGYALGAILIYNAFRIKT
jgi:hypothetical protein